MKTVGIIGGLGPETTAEFYLELVFMCQSLNATARPHILIESVPLPLNIEEEAIAKSKGEERCLPYLIDAAKRLEKAGADFLVMPCNTLHTFIEDIRSSVSIPVLSIVEETVAFLEQENIEAVGVVATAITMDKKLYQSKLGVCGIQQVTPDDFQQAKIGKIIHNLVNGRHSNGDRKELIAVIDDFEAKGVEYVILACTDLQILIPEHVRLKIYDTMKLFADATVREIINEGEKS